MCCFLLNNVTSPYVEMLQYHISNLHDKALSKTRDSPAPDGPQDSHITKIKARGTMDNCETQEEQWIISICQHSSISYISNNVMSKL